MLNFADFVPVSVQDRETLTAQILRSGVKSCEFSFANLVMWGKSFDIRYARYNGHLYFSEFDEEEKERGLFFLPSPGNEPTPAELREISDALRDETTPGRYFCVDAGYLGRNADCGKFFSVSPMDDSADEYLYETEKLATLAGEKLAKKRNLIAQFLRDHPDASTRTIDASLAKECLKMAEAWRANRPDRDDPDVLREKAALETAFGAFDRLGLVGLAAFAGGEMVAFEVCSPISGNICDEHFEKALHGCKGAAQFINRETAKMLLPRAKYLNREQDMGLPGLRQAKLSYAPCEVLKLFVLSPR
ncbi:MAG: phosphatidylglycerol lysyltransferase domain-containing protein [Victivallaceae bacterium]|nr:phosphatidylglycerol lysyltransferase domain-containing protein [Victivallaceae bacterium]